LQEDFSMYESLFQLKRRPFAAIPDPLCFLGTDQMQAAVDELVVCVEQGQGIAVVSAPAGTGKTLLCERLRAELQDTFEVIFLHHATFLTRRALLQALLADLNHSYRRHDEQELRLELLPAIRALNPKREALVLICDEAHRLTEDLLEELRTLSDLAEHGKPLVRLVLVGQPTLEETLAQPGLEALNQRIRAHVCLEPFDRATSMDYIDYRITWAGGRTDEVFTADALDHICRASEGVPRRINQLCDHALLLGYVAEQKPVAADLVLEALKDLRQLPLHWNEPLSAMSTDDLPANASCEPESVLEIASSDEPSVSFEIGAELPTGDWDTELEDELAADEFAAEMDSVNQASTQRLVELSFMAVEAPQVCFDRGPTIDSVEASPQLKPGEVVEEPVVDRYAAIDGGFSLPSVAKAEPIAISSQTDTPTEQQVHVDPESVASSEIVEHESTGDDFSEVCTRLEEMLPTETSEAAWDAASVDREFRTPREPVSESQAPQDDWQSLEVDLGLSVCELAREVREVLPQPECTSSPCEALEQVLSEVPGTTTIEIGAVTESESRPVSTRGTSGGRPFRNLFSQLRRKQQGLI
jgi:type II secretory pathway predicted ATPase ExeA